MSKKSLYSMRPFLSVLIIIGSLFTLVFFQMEVRRMGYVVLKQSREYKTMVDQNRLRSMEYAKVMRPERLREVALTTMTLSEARSGQIIHMSGERVAFRQ